MPAKKKLTAREQAALGRKKAWDHGLPKNQTPIIKNQYGLGLSAAIRKPTVHILRRAKGCDNTCIIVATAVSEDVGKELVDLLNRAEALKP